MLERTKNSVEASGISAADDTIHFSPPPCTTSVHISNHSYSPLFNHSLRHDRHGSCKLTSSDITTTSPAELVLTPRESRQPSSTLASFSYSQPHRPIYPVRIPLTSTFSIDQAQTLNNGNCSQRRTDKDG